MAIPVIGMGAGGHAKVVIEVLRVTGDYQVVGLLDLREELWGQELLGVTVIGGDAKLSQVLADGVTHAFIGVGSTGEVSNRVRVYDLLLEPGFAPISAIHPGAAISPSVLIGRGATVMNTAVINADVTLGENVIVNTGSIVEHECTLGNHVHVATGAILAGGVVVGDEAHIGAGAIIRQCLRIGRRALVGAGAVVVQDVPEGQTVVGNPARAMGRSSRA